MNTLLLASALMIAQPEDSTIIAAIHRTRYECVSIMQSEYLGQKNSSQEFLVTCTSQKKYLVSIDKNNNFRVWVK